MAVGATRSGAAGYGDLDYWNQRYAKAVRTQIIARRTH